jgi:glycosyltransferase involved in cell wall biosynthesis
LAGAPAAAFREQLHELTASYGVVRFPLTWKTTWQLGKELRRKRPAIVLTSFISPFTLRVLALKLLGAMDSLVVIDHSSGVASPKTGWRKRLAWLRGHLTGRLVDRVLPVSNANARRDIEDVFLPAAKVQRVYNGIALERFNAAPRAPGPVRVAYAGQLTPEKGVLTLLKALRQLPDQYEITIAGKGRQEAELREYCRTRGLERVQFAGHVADVGKVFSAADVVVAPSEWEEAFGLVAAEAMACGAAVIVSDAGGLPEVVGNAGLVFRRGDVADLAGKLRQLIDSPQQRLELSRLGRRRVEEMFSLDRCVAERLAVLDLLSRQTRGASGAIIHG